MLPGVGRVGSLLRTIEDEMSDMLSRVGTSGALNPSDVVCTKLTWPGPGCTVLWLMSVKDDFGL